LAQALLASSCRDPAARRRGDGRGGPAGMAASGRLVAQLLALLLPVDVSQGLDNSLGQTPPMGYNTWNDLRCENVTAENIRQIADAIVLHGLDKAGYVYVNVDDCWATARDDGTNRIIPDPKGFPDGMRAVADYVHSKGLKFGLYTDRGWFTCGTRPGSQGHEEIDAQTYAAWGVDYLKEDSCNAPHNPDKAFEQYGIMRDALNATGRPIFFALCGWNPWYAPYGASLGNSWRVAVDVNNWSSLWNAVATNSELSAYASVGAWNDPDALLGSTPGSARVLAPHQVRTQFSLWAVMAAPLMIGSNIRAIGASDLDTYTNAEVIAVDQDPLGVQGGILWEDCPPRDMLDLHVQSKTILDQVPACKQVWGKRLADRTVAVLFVNWSPVPAWVEVDAGLMRRIGFSHDVFVRDLWLKKNYEGARGHFKAYVAGDGTCALYKFSELKMYV